jgi:hypothetical protein
VVQVAAVVASHTATFVTLINKYFFMVLVYNVYKNCTANEFVLNEKRVG